MSTATQLKLIGMTRAAAKHREALTEARAIAYRLATALKEPITINTMRAYYSDHAKEWNLGNSAGSLFSDKTVWEFAGHCKATHPASHGRDVKAWRLKNGQ